jgi:hypothetical protein
MKCDILKKYNVSFLKDAEGCKYSDGKNVLSSYLFIWRDIDDINDFLIDIDLCLSGRFNEVEDPDYNDSLLKIYGRLTPDALILSGEGGVNPSSVPLSDFKAILESWREFLAQP